MPTSAEACANLRAFLFTFTIGWSRRRSMLARWLAAFSQATADTCWCRLASSCHKPLRDWFPRNLSSRRSIDFSKSSPLCLRTAIWLAFETFIGRLQPHPMNATEPANATRRTHLRSTHHLNLLAHARPKLYLRRVKGRQP